MAVSFTHLSPQSIALNRFGLGARPSDHLQGQPKAWLTGQFERFEVQPAAFAALPDAGEIVRQYRDEQRANRGAAQAAPAGADPKAQARMVRSEFRDGVQNLYRSAVQARVDSALQTEAPFVERLVHFWSNHFCVSADNPQVTAFAGAFERDAIRPHVLGSFSDMLMAVEHHPAMLFYLNQVTSIGPNSPAAKRAEMRNQKRRPGLNENLGREIMELHTLGVRSGYTQTDVTEFSRALTGWTVGGLGQGPAAAGNPDQFEFRPAQHEPGVRTILGRRYAEDGEAQARAVLQDFARNEATAKHIAEKLGRHFAGDTPPKSLVTRLASAFLNSGGNLPSVYRVLIDSPEAWAQRPLKFKSPWEWTISAMRATGTQQAGKTQMAGLMAQLGQPVWRPGSPAGWDDIAASWAGPDALLRRVEVASRFAAPVGDRLDARLLAARLMPASLSQGTSDEVARAESPTSALALLLVSPDFLRR